jgi:hypothetical protein
MSVFKTTKLTKRPSLGSYVKGKWVKSPGDAAGVQFMGTAQPASGKAMELLPEGKRSSETIQVFAPIEIEFTPADSGKQVGGDIIVWQDRCYEVQVAKKWDNGLLPHWELIATREKEGER